MKQSFGACEGRLRKLGGGEGGGRGGKGRFGSRYGGCGGGGWVGGWKRRGGSGRRGER